MTTTTEARTPVVSAVRTTVIVGDDAAIGVAHFTNHPAIGCYQVSLDGGATLYLTEESAKALVSSLARVIAAAHGESAVA